MRVIESVDGMRSICRRLKRHGKSIRMVPTMGALHNGHDSLIRRAVEDNAPDGDDFVDDGGHGDSYNGDHNHHAATTNHSERSKVVVVSIFANPIQFNDRNDFLNYPNTLEADLKRCQDLGVDYVFVPKCDQIYPTNSPLPFDRSNQLTKSRCIIRPPADMAQILEGKSRDSHFEGVLTVVCKLFNIVQPDRAYFGIKDYQQLVLIRKMTRDLNLPIMICAVETVREVETNLPLSSRNVRLDTVQRQLAAQLMYDTLISTKKCLEDRCRRGNQLGSDCASSEELNSILLASMMTSQLCLDLNESDIVDQHRYCDNNSSSRLDQVTVDYFELRCAKDLSLIDYNQNLAAYDCQLGCVRSQVDHKTEVIDVTPADAVVVLEARLLISILVSKVRLLDNIDVQLNL